MKEFTQYLEPTSFIDSDHPAVSAFAKKQIGQELDQRKRAVLLYYAVRDGFRYDPYRIDWSQVGLKASTTLARRHGYCATKAILLTALGRAIGIPSRLGYADVKNHLTSKRLKEAMKTDIFLWHGYSEFYLNQRWVKATPAFNKSLCKMAGIKTLEFSGLQESVFHEFDAKGQKHMEYIRDHGPFADVPFERMEIDLQKLYGNLFQSGGKKGDIEGDFESDALAGDES